MFITLFAFFKTLNSPNQQQLMGFFLEKKVPMYILRILCGTFRSLWCRTARVMKEFKTSWRLCTKWDRPKRPSFENKRIFFKSWTVRWKLANRVKVHLYLKRWSPINTHVTLLQWTIVMCSFCICKFLYYIWPFIIHNAIALCIVLCIGMNTIPMM